MLKVLEVCTVSSSAYALVFNRAHTLNQQYAGQMQIDLLCTDGAEVSLMRATGMQVITATLHRSLNPIKLLQSSWSLYSVIRQGNYAVIHLHFGIPGLIGRFLAVFLRQPVWIYQSHGYSITENTSAIARTAYLLVEKLFKNTVRYSLFQLREDIALAQHHRLLAPEQIVYLGNGIDTRRFAPVASETPASTLTVFGMVARFEAVKNHALLLDAVELLAQQTTHFKLKLIGQGHLRTQIERLIAQKGLTQWVEIEAYRNDMPAFYRSIDVAVLTSQFEGIPRALIEPMACGKPVICTDVKGSREAIIDQQTGFTTPLGKPELLAQRLLWFIQNPEKRLLMGKTARAHALQHFQEERIIRQLGDLYLACAKSNTSPQVTEVTV